jgi:RNA polymerase sigma-70 factor, ECF subfamily
MNGTSDDELLEIARDGGRRSLRAYEELVRRHQGRVLRLATYLLSSEADAQDITQEVFLRAHGNLSRLEQGSSFSAWMRVVTTRLCFNLRRDRATRARNEQGDADERVASPSSARTAVEWTLAQLPYPYREVLILRYVEELSLEEIAHTLDVGLSAAKMRLTRARQSFAEVYEREHKTPPPTLLEELS